MPGSVALERLSVPRAGRTVATAAEDRAVHVRAAVQLLQDGLKSQEFEPAFQELFAPRWPPFDPVEPPHALRQRAAWAVANVWLLYRSAGNTRGKLEQAESWFLRGGCRRWPSLVQCIAPKSRQAALATLSVLAGDPHLKELLPYILEPHGPGSRLSVMRDPSTRKAREAKKRQGVFYTPADVADYMVDAVIRQHPKPWGQIQCLDPCCGTGVYLAAMLSAATERGLRAFDYALACLYGIDLSPLAVDSSCFVVLHHCLRELAVSPWCAWHAIRMNLAVSDALRLRRSEDSAVFREAAARRAKLRKRLLRSDIVPSEKTHVARAAGSSTDLLGDGPKTIGALFPEAAAGFGAVVGNPPYAPIGRRTDRSKLQKEFRSLGNSAFSPATNSYLLFIETLWRLTQPGQNASSLVVPLSIAYHQGKPYQACRQAISSSGGRWRFAFFDRQPHALFGEDVKTRSAILIRRESPADPPRGKPAEIETGPLRKWTSRTRAQLFEEISFTPIGRIGITQGIPKLSGKRQAEAYTRLAAGASALSRMWLRTRKVLPAEATRESELPRVFLASTAYNFLNVFLDFTRLESEKAPLSENPVHCFECPDQQTAYVLFAILSSRLAFWLWHVEGDGFHVAGGLAERLPFSRASFRPDQLAALKQAGRRLWSALQKHRIVSLNKGRTTVAFRPLACQQERDAIDAILLEASGLPKAFARDLRQFVQNTVVVDVSDKKRSYSTEFFELGETRK